jgi:hypothetical protein
MITAKNLSTAKIDFSKLPAKFKEDYGDIVEMVPYMDQEPDFKQVINSYVAGLNLELSKTKPKAKAKAPKFGAKPTTLTAFLSKEKKKLGKMYSSSFESSLKDQHYQDIEKHVKAGGTITQEVFDSLDGGKQFHFNKHYNYRGGKIAEAKKPTSNKSGRSQSKAEAATAKAAYEADKRKAEAGEFKQMSRNEVLAIAQRVHKNRRLSAQILDEAVDHKKRLTPTPENLVRWMKEPGKYDLIGIDTFEKNNPTADLKIKKEIFWARLLKK